MRVVKVCHTCERILGEIELDDLTSAESDSIMDIVGNISYTLCPSCLNEMETESRNVFH